MVTLEDVRRIALSLPEVYETPDGHRGTATWRVKKEYIALERNPGKTDLKRLAELGRSWPEGPTAAVHVDGLEIKAALISTHPDIFFTIPHFEGYPAVLIQLDHIDLDHLEELIIESWLIRAPKRLAKQWLAERDSAES